MGMGQLWLLALLAGSAHAALDAPEERVNTRYGTAGSSYMSYGNLVPLVTTPFGMNAWSVQTRTKTNDGWWWGPDEGEIFGLRCSHRPSPWINDYGYFGVLPTYERTGYDGEWPVERYDPEASTTQWRPYLFAAQTASGIGIEQTSTDHATIIRSTFDPASGQQPVLRVQMSRRSDSIEFDSASQTISGVTQTGQGNNAFPMPIAGSVSAQGGNLVSSRNVLTNDGPVLLLTFSNTTTSVEARLATSFISQEQAQTNLKQVDGSFESVRDASKQRWNKLLVRYQIEDPAATDAQLSIVYTSMYHALTFPRFISEITADGKEVHFSPYKGSGVFDGPLVSDSGFWDAYRTVYSFLEFVDPDLLGRVVQGWVNSYKEGGWLPKWASPGYRDSMVGTMGDTVLANAIVNDIKGFDVEGAYAAITRDGTVAAPRGDTSEGRVSLPSYLQLGYVPNGEKEDVSVSLNYMMADWATANAARKLGKPGADEFFQRSQNYSKLFHNGFFTSKDRYGNWDPFFDEFAWGKHYTESGPWQYRFYTPWDPAGLKKMYADNGLDVCELLNEAMTMPGTYHVGGYGSVIHEMREMAENCWGQYAHNNQPAHHMLYMFIATSDSVSDKCAQTGQQYLRRAMQELYHADPKMYAGDEDNGEMSAWFLLSAMGIYNLQPSSGNIFLGIPLFTSMSLALPGGKSLKVTTTGGDNTKQSFVKSVTWNGAPIEGVTIPYKTLMQGGELAFTLDKSA